MDNQIDSPTKSHSIHTQCIDLLSVLTLAVFSIYQFYVWKLWNFDDAYIVYRIVLHILEGKGWVYNVGELHNASTSVLNTVLICIGSIPFYFGDRSIIPIVAHVVNAGCIFLSALCCYVYLKRRSHPILGLATALMLISLLAKSSSWGLETHLFTFLSLFFVLLQRRKYLPFIISGLLVLARPDGALFGIFLVIYRFFSKKWGIKNILAGSFLAGLIVSPWLAYSLINFGQLFPDTLSNKMWQGSSGLWGTGYVYLKGLLSHLKEYWYYLPLSVPGLMYCIRRIDAFLFIVLFCLVQQGVYSILNVPAYHWYFVSLDVCLLVLSALGVAFIFPFINVLEVNLKNPALSYSATGIALLFSFYTLYTSQFPPRIDQRDAAYRNAIDVIHHKHLPSGSLAVLEAGTPGFFSDRPIVDLIGLVSNNPPYVSGGFNDEFYQKPPQILLLQNPIWHFERAITDDVRFEMLYSKVAASNHSFRNMQIFNLRKDHGALTEESVASYISQHYANPQALESKDMLSFSRDDFLCAIDQIDGKMATGRLTTLSRKLLKLNGWAAITSPATASKEAFLILKGTADLYSVPLQRHPRPDVAKEINLPMLENTGFSGKASLGSLAAGEYEVFIVEPALKRICGPGKFIQVP